jgi:putative endonuclease
MLVGLEKKERASRRKKKSPRAAVETEPLKEWSLYILKCSDGTFYTGISNNLERRLKMHQSGKASRYTRTRGPVEMLYSETCGNRSSALIRECEVKEWPRAKKEKLINARNVS